MKITVKGVKKTTFDREVTFKESLRSSETEFTDVGVRVIRIVKHLAGKHVMMGFVGDYVSVSGGDQKHFESVSTLQKQMDRYANTKIGVRFNDPVVRPLRSTRTIRNMEEVTRYYEEERLHDGILVVTQDATLSMPATVRDITLIRAFVPGGDVWRPDDTTNVVRIKIRLIDEELRKADPWKLVQGLHPQIRGAIY
jgi:hypothetical protein